MDDSHGSVKKEPVEKESLKQQPVRRRSVARIAASVVGLCLVAMIALLAFRPAESQAENALVGSRVPKVAGQTLDGEPYDIDDARGKWVVVNFFATWCPGCIREHPELVTFDEWAEDSGQAEVVAVVFNDPADRVEQFFADEGGDWPVLDKPSVPIDFQVSQIPETFVVAPSGVVVSHITGEVSAADLVELIETNS